MEEKNELNDIILNKSTHNSNNKKLLLAVATLAIFLIIVVVIMNSLKSEGTDNLPQAVLPPEPVAQSDTLKDDPLFEPVEVVEEDNSEDLHLNEIAQKLKKESLNEDKPEVITDEEVVVVEPKPLTPPSKTLKAKPKAKPVKYTQATKPKPAYNEAKSITKGRFYVQVGSFTKFKPSATFIGKIKAEGFSYTYHKVNINGRDINKVLIGPFKSKTEANKARKKIRSTIEPGAFTIKI